MIHKLDNKEIVGSSDVEKESLLFTIIFLLALLLRVVMFFSIKGIAPDSPNYIYETQRLIDYGFKEFFSQGFAGIFTIYPIFIYLLNLVVDNLLVSAKIVSLIFGTAVIFPLYLIARKLVGTRAALITAFCFATHPYLIRYSAEILKDTTLFFFSITALYFAFTGLWKKKYLFFFLAGVFSWITVLVRLYGIVLIFAIPFALIVSELKDKRSIKEILINLFLFLVPIPLFGFIFFYIFVGPEKEFVIESFTNLVLRLDYNAYNDYANSLINNLPPKVSSDYIELITNHFFIAATAKFFNVFFTAFTGFLFTLFVAGIYLDRKNIIKDKLRLFIISFSFPFFAFDFGIIFTHFIITKRQILPLILILLPWSAISLEAILWWLKERMSTSKKFLRWSSRWIILFVFFIWAFSTLLYVARPYREKIIYQEEAGKYIKETAGEGATILANKYSSRAIFYAGGKEEYFPAHIVEDSNKFLYKIEVVNPDYIFWDTRIAPLPDSFGELEDKGIIEFDKKFVSIRDEVVYIYRVKK